jgi:hypothetical protein
VFLHDQRCAGGVSVFALVLHSDLCKVKDCQMLPARRSPAASCFYLTRANRRLWRPGDDVPENCAEADRPVDLHVWPESGFVGTSHGFLAGSVGCQPG